MVYEVNPKKKVFLDSLVLTILVLLIGFSLGFYFESFRTNKIVDSYKDYEVEALDLKLQNYYYQIMDRSACDQAIDQNFNFADELYLQGLELEKFEQSNQITDDLLREKRRYVLLKTELWLNTLLLNEKCRESFDTVVYIYSQEADAVKSSQQKIISNVLEGIKEGKGNEIVLIPIAGDLGLESVELQMRIYNVTYLPSIIINEDIVLEGFHTEEEILSHLNN